MNSIGEKLSNLRKGKRLSQEEAWCYKTNNFKMGNRSINARF